MKAHVGEGWWWPWQARPQGYQPKAFGQEASWMVLEGGHVSIVLDKCARETQVRSQGFSLSLLTL